MRALERRLKRLEQRFQPAEETWFERRLRARLEAARKRGGLPPIAREESQGRADALRGLTLAERLIAARRRAQRKEEERSLADTAHSHENDAA